MDTLTAISILINQVKNINDEIFNYVQNVVCPKVSAPDEVRWTYLNLSKDSLWITPKDPYTLRILKYIFNKNPELKNTRWYHNESKNIFGE